MNPAHAQRILREPWRRRTGGNVFAFLGYQQTLVCCRFFGNTTILLSKSWAKTMKFLAARYVYAIPIQPDSNKSFVNVNRTAMGTGALSPPPTILASYGFDRVQLEVRIMANLLVNIHCGLTYVGECNICDKLRTLDESCREGTGWLSN